MELQPGFWHLQREIPQKTPMCDRDSGGAVYRVKLSDDEQICGAVQGLQKIGKNVWQ